MHHATMLEPTQPSADTAWERVLARDPTADGSFVYAVTTTGICCRPSCPSRRPARQYVRFFATVDEAVAAGFRTCLRCRPAKAGADAEAEVVLVRQLSEYLRRNLDRAVTLAELGKLAGRTGTAVQRTFERALGVSPRQFQIDLRAAGFRDLLGEAAPFRITDAVYDAGYSASSRLYSQSSAKLGMTPSRFRDGGRGERIEFAVAPCVLGFVIAAATGIGVCWVALGDSPEALETGLRERFHRAEIAPGATGPDAPLSQAVTAILAQLGSAASQAAALPLDLRATVFQQRVWKALAAIPRGETRSYGQVAAALGQPTASRAVARACASNPVALLVPCHRVVGGDGALTGYRWGTERKQQLLALEKAAR